MHSQLAPTEHASLNLAPLILLDPVFLKFMVHIPRRCANIGLLSEVNDESWDTSLLSCIIIFIYPVANWLSVKYQYHLTVSLFTFTMVTGIEPVTYFYNFVKPGAIVHQVKEHLLVIL